ncbi:hypothetical protein [Methylobacterium sp. Leaf89]|uniref:hypothetical protein n=1 Tax=Methylobacterium sp. Leaf89 TaxID=1736245 RepID=UPI000ADA0D53|nr:hypothetical protein [Methylobacterium sp. Leaf89]
MAFGYQPPNTINITEQNLQPRLLERIFSRSSSLKLAYIGGFFLVSSVLLYILSVALDARREPGFEFPAIYVSSISFFIALTFLALAIFVFSGAYLEVFGDDVWKQKAELTTSLNQLSEDLNEIRRKVESIPQSKTDEQIDRFVLKSFETNIKDHIDAKFRGSVRDIAKSELLIEFAPNIFKEKSYALIKAEFSSYIDGLHKQIERQQRNSNFNVLCGMAFAVVGLIAMGYFIYQNYGRSVENQSWQDFLMTFLPRLTFVILFESVAFFFFQAYKEDRGMVRFLRNEATNTESKIVGLISSVLFGKDKSVDGAISALMATERNFTVKKGDKVILETLQVNQKPMIETLIESLVPNIYSQIKKAESRKEGSFN